MSSPISKIPFNFFKRQIPDALHTLKSINQSLQNLSSSIDDLVDRIDVMEQRIEELTHGEVQ